MHRVRLTSPNTRFGTLAAQREVTGECDAEYASVDECFSRIALRDGDVLHIPHALVLGKFHLRDKAFHYLAGRGVRLSIGGSEPLDMEKPEDRATAHAMSRIKTGRPKNPKRGAGRPSEYPEPNEDQMRLLQEWWKGDQHHEVVGDMAGEMLKCRPVSRMKLIAWLGNRPPNPNRKRKKRRDAGVSKFE